MMASIFRNRVYFVLLSLVTLALAGWFGWRWHLAERQTAQGRELPASLAAAAVGPVAGYELPEEVTVEFVRYGPVQYRKIPVRYVPEPAPDEARVSACGYEPLSQPWLQHQAVLVGRNPHLAVLHHEFFSETAAAAARLDVMPGFVADFSDSRGFTCLRRLEPQTQAPNEIVVVRLGREVWVFDTVDDPVGLRAVAAAGFRYGAPGPAADTPPR